MLKWLQKLDRKLEPFMTEFDRATEPVNQVTTFEVFKRNGAHHSAERQALEAAARTAQNDNSAPQASADVIGEPEQAPTSPAADGMPCGEPAWENC
ncbi:MAG: hypothetical protein GYB65_19740 [Chloroflexi bacterium]|nr:hypothetical protein [Chloroflexota bacterium]